MVAEDWRDKLGRVRNLGEDMYRELLKSGEGAISLADVGRATDTLSVDVRKSRNLGSVLRLIERLSDYHFPEQSPKVTVTKV